MNWFSKLSIQKKIQNSTVILIVAALIIISVIFIIRSVQNTNDTLKATLERLADVTADRVMWELKATEAVALEIGTITRFSNPDVSIEEKQDLLKTKIDYHGMLRGHILDLNGISLFDENLNVSDREYFKQAMQGNAYITKPTVSRTTGQASIFVAAPLWKDGNVNTEIVGAVMLVLPGDTMNNIVNSVSVSKNSFVYMIDNEGYTIADMTMDSIYAEENVEEIAKEDRSLRKLAALHTKMRAGESGSTMMNLLGKNEVLAYAPLKNGSGWSVVVHARAADFMSGLYITIALVVALVVLLIIIGFVVAGKIGKIIGVPLQKCTERLQVLATGNLSNDDLQVDSEDETKVLADATNEITRGLTDIIRDVRYMLDEMGNGNFTAKSQNPAIYEGDFAPILAAYRTLNQRLSETIHHIKDVSHQVTAGSDQLTKSSQGLAEGATDQSAAVEELQATITTVTEQIGKSADEQKKIFNMAMQMEEVAEHSSVEMENLKTAMKRINETSQQIESIISGIEDIASQTNLLSLNASIEAARAGEAGRGFAVVANEIRSLAEGSAKSAVNTRELIETAIKEARNGDEITEKTATSLSEVISGLKSIEGNIKEVTESSTIQVGSMREIEHGISQISDVIQSNSALAEESSAISEEFSGQASTLEELINRFQVEKK
ncbi:MAG: methyl-accepting chemotaxis protein [Lachnospiraceae bacterium]|nr:methyl-accepting chemotaxis protein [Lachnospiraceae bacterium]